MTTHLSTALEKLKKTLLTVVSLTEDQLTRAIRSFENRDGFLAREVVERDSEVDAMEVDLEEECLKTLALHQPVAFDLRFIVSVIKINNDLERIADLAANIASRCISLQEHLPQKYPFDFVNMAERARSMLKLSIDALIKLDASLARKVCEADEEIDKLHKAHFTLIRESIIAHPEHGKFLIEFLSVSRYLERIADHVTNIAEDVIYLVEGTIVRHTQW